MLSDSDFERALLEIQSTGKTSIQKPKCNEFAAFNNKLKT